MMDKCSVPVHSASGLECFRAGPGRDIYSVTFFFGVNYDATIETLSNCLEESEKSKYPPVLAGDYV